MNYQEALKRWGKAKLEEVGYTDINLDDVDVQMNFDEGYPRGSMAESPSANVEIKAHYSYRTISIAEFDFVEVLGEIVAIADGHVTD